MFYLVWFHWNLSACCSAGYNVAVRPEFTGADGSCLGFLAVSRPIINFVNARSLCVFRIGFFNVDLYYVPGVLPVSSGGFDEEEFVIMCEDFVV